MRPSPKLKQTRGIGFTSLGYFEDLAAPPGTTVNTPAKAFKNKYRSRMVVFIQTKATALVGFDPWPLSYFWLTSPHPLAPVAYMPLSVWAKDLLCNEPSCMLSQRRLAMATGPRNAIESKYPKWGSKANCSTKPVVSRNFRVNPALSNKTKWGVIEESMGYSWVNHLINHHDKTHKTSNATFQTAWTSRVSFRICFRILDICELRFCTSNN